VTPEARRRRLALVVAAALALVVGIAAGAGHDDPHPRSPAPRASATPTPPPVKEARKLSLRRQVGQLVVMRFAGTGPPAYVPEALKAGRAAGVILFKDNIASKPALTRLTASLQRAAGGAALVATDQEGGEIRNLTWAAPAAGQAAAATPERARADARAAAHDLRAAGINVNLAPVADVASGAVMRGRSFPGDAEQVAALTRAAVEGYRGTHVAATAKHFPGLGPAAKSQNTDLQPVTLTLTKNQIRSIDELPYRQAITAGTKLIMVSWASYPSLGTKRPAGLASIVVNGELRKRLGYTGVTITDALEAGALKPYGGTSQRAIMAATAGMDLILCSVQNPSQGIDAVTALTGAYRDGTLDRTKFRDAARRILALRMSLPG
jgi:beta-N-acetylhexosaminidase